MKIKKGNATNFSITIKDKASNVIEDLFNATNVYFMLKENQTDTDAVAVVSKSLNDGVTSSGITVNNPTTGIINIAITKTDTNLNPGDYYPALQIEYPDFNQEIILKDVNTPFKDLEKITIIEDTIRG